MKGYCTLRRMITNVSCALLVLLSFLLLTVSHARVNIVTTVAPITNIVENVGGDLVNVNGVVPDGVNSHTFEPAPSDAKVLSRADIIIVNGLHLEVPTVKLATSVKKRTTAILQLGDNTITEQQWKFDFSFPRDQGHPNPHLWPNVALTMRYAELVRDALIMLDQVNTEKYYQYTTEYLAKLSKLDAAIFDCVTSIPAANRKLVTYHDSYAYFAPRYGMKVIGAIQPADFSEPTPKEVGRIIKQLRQQKVPAVFGSEVFPSKVLVQIAKEADAKFVDQLADDDLPGKRGDVNHTYIGMMKQNMILIARALGGEGTCMDHIDASNISVLKN